MSIENPWSTTGRARSPGSGRAFNSSLLLAFCVPSLAAVMYGIGSTLALWTDGLLWIIYMVATAVVSAIMGLIFGVPRARTDFSAASSERYSSNSNLEQISDWLTKLLVGAGLVQLNSLPGLMADGSAYLGSGMSFANAQAFSLSALLYGSGLGFATGYLWARLRLRMLLEWSDREAALASRRDLIESALRDSNVGAKQPDSRRAIRDAADAAISATKDSVQVYAPILWVDDRPGNNTSLVSALTALGIQVDLALTTAEALERLPGRYGLLISDLGRLEGGEQRDMAGRELAIQARKAGFARPIFIYAGTQAVSYEDELKAAGVSLVTSQPSVLFETAVRTVATGSTR